MLSNRFYPLTYLLLQEELALLSTWGHFAIDSIAFSPFVYIFISNHSVLQKEPVVVVAWWKLMFKSQIMASYDQIMFTPVQVWLHLFYKYINPNTHK